MTVTQSGQSGQTRQTGLGSRDRDWARLASLAWAGPAEALAARVRQILGRDESGLGDLLEFVLQYAVYAGWPRGSELEGAVRCQWALHCRDTGTDPASWPAPAATSLDRESREERLRAGEEAFRAVNRSEAPPRGSPFVEAGMLGFVFGQVWRRPGLTTRERRIVAIVVCAAAGAVHPLRHHVRSALDSADLSAADLRDLLTEVEGRIPAPAAAVLRDGSRPLPPR